MVKELPSATRNPFQLAMLDPTTIQRGSTVETAPYFHRTANEMDIGGGTKYRNDVLLDGTPLTAGDKLGYTPPMDSVSEYTIQQNSVDAEFGHSAGGIAIVTMKSGTNNVKGSAYYFGRSPSLNATSDRAVHRSTTTTRTGTPAGRSGCRSRRTSCSCSRSSTRSTTPSRRPATTRCRARSSARATSRSRTTPTARLRVIYDPLTSRTVNGVQVRDPFPGNRIPANRWDPVAAQILGGLWLPNNAGDDLTGFNNFKYQQELTFHYLNFSTRLDWNISRPLEGERARQPHAHEPGRQRLHGRQRPAEAAQHHGLQAQRLERGGRHRLHLQPLHHAQRPRLVLPGRGQARLPGHGRSASRATRACGRTAGGSRTRRTGRSSTRPTSWWTARAARQFGVAELLVPAAQGLQHARPPQQVLRPSTRSRPARRSASSAATRRASTTRDLRFVARETADKLDEPDAPRPATPGRASCSARWTPRTRGSATRSCRSPTPSSTASTSRTTGR